MVIFILNMEMLNYYIPFKALNGNYCFMFILVNTILISYLFFLALKQEIHLLVFWKFLRNSSWVQKILTADFPPSSPPSNMFWFYSPPQLLLDSPFLIHPSNYVCTSFLNSLMHVCLGQIFLDISLSNGI